MVLISPSGFSRLVATAGQPYCGVERTLKGSSPWRSLEQVRSRRRKDPVTGLPAPSVSIRCFRPPLPPELRVRRGHFSPPPPPPCPPLPPGQPPSGNPGPAGTSPRGG